MRMKKFLGIFAALLMVLLVVPRFPLGVHADGTWTVPEGYDEYEYNQLAAFLEIEDENGVKNGEKIAENGDYDVNDPDTWKDGWVFWPSFDDGLSHVIDISWSDCDLVGEIDVSGFTELMFLYLDENRITSIDASNCVQLSDVQITYGSFVTADFSGCESLEHLLCDDNELVSLNVSGCTALSGYFDCSNNHLTELDVSGCSSLTSLVCDNNDLTSLNVSGCSALTTINAQENELSEIDLSDCVSLDVLNLSGNKFSYIDMTGIDGLVLDEVTADGPGYVGYWDTNMNGGPFVQLFAYPMDNCEFIGWYNGETCVGTEPEWVVSDVLDTVGLTPEARFVANGYRINLDNLASAETSINVNAYYLGEVVFTVSSTDDIACAVGVLNDDGTITRLNCLPSRDGEHRYSVTVTDSEITIIVVVRGDANLDGAVSTRDVTAIVRHATGRELLTGAALFAADANKDNDVTTRDVTAIIRNGTQGVALLW